MVRYLVKLIMLNLVILTTIVSSDAHALDFQEWLTAQKKVSEEQILANISPKGTLAGTVIASPSRTNPDYYYHWIRDAALTMLAIQELGFGAPEALLKDFLNITKIHQDNSGNGNLGEPKYLVNGEPYTGPWGRPQNDGPALRAIVFANWATQLLNQNQLTFVKDNIYDGQWDSKSPLKRDLQYVAHHWQDLNFDLWEEVKGEHYFTLAVSRKALILGAEIAGRLNDRGAMSYYLGQAELIKNKILTFVRNKRLYATLNSVEGLTSKSSNRDVAVLLGLIHGDLQDGFLSFDNPIVNETLRDLQSSFNSLYIVNWSGPAGIAFGRYPEDVYYNGNPWFLTTLAQAEVLYKMAKAAALSAKPLKKVQSLFDQGDLVMKRVQFHVPSDLHLTEQFDKTSGFCLGATDLTWSYASFLTALHAREAALAALNK